jgi:Transposase domain (DUF772)
MFTSATVSRRRTCRMVEHGHTDGAVQSRQIFRRAGQARADAKRSRHARYWPGPAPQATLRPGPLNSSVCEHRGTRSLSEYSRKIAKACEERLDVMAVTGMQRPDFRTISDFRKRHLEALAGLFTEVLRLCR